METGYALLHFEWRMSLSENRRPPPPSRGQAFSGTCASVSFEHVHSGDERGARRGRRGALAIAAAFSHPRSRRLAISDCDRSSAGRPPFGQRQPHGLDGASDLGVTLLEPRKGIFQNLLGSFGLDCHDWPHARITPL